MTNTDTRALAFKDRLIRLEESKHEIAEDMKDLATEMKSSGLLKEEIAGIKLAVKRYFESDEKRKFRESAEDFAAALGDFKDLPLGVAAMARAIVEA